MKNLIIMLIAFTMLIFIVKTNEEKILTIPDEAIRLRVIANSNSLEDQAKKNKVRIFLQEELASLLEGEYSISKARVVVENHLETINQKLGNYIKNEKLAKTYKLEYGDNYFPKKELAGVTYNEGYYESILITLDAGKGDNWWCVLFPPLCLLEAEDATTVEYSLFISKVLKDYFR